jgi:hypothetical protein
MTTKGELCVLVTWILFYASIWIFVYQHAFGIWWLSWGGLEERLMEKEGEFHGDDDGGKSSEDIIISSKVGWMETERVAAENLKPKILKMLGGCMTLSTIQSDLHRQSIKRGPFKINGGCEISTKDSIVHELLWFLFLFYLVPHLRCTYRHGNLLYVSCMMNTIIWNSSETDPKRTLFYPLIQALGYQDLIHSLFSFTCISFKHGVEPLPP